MSSERLLVLGAGSQARYILETVRHLPELEVIGLTDTFGNPDFWGKEIGGTRVLGGIDETLERTPPTSDLCVVLAVAALEQKRTLARRLVDAGYRFRSIVHPRACIATTATLGVGCVINAGVTIETDTTIGEHCIIHSGTVIEHDNVLAPFVNVGPGVSTAGRVKLREGATIFTGATILPDVEVGEAAVVGAGAVVLERVPARQTVVGVPARTLS